MKRSCHNKMLWIGLLLFLFARHSAQANVYATDIRINGSFQAGIVLPGSPLTISYILNDIATNVSVQIYTGTNVVKTFDAGTNVGLNTVVWDGTNDDGFAAAVGAYNVSITAAAAGYEQWTNITDDGVNFFVNLPTGIAVNKNTNSPYYGRVFVGNSYEQVGGMGVGILKCNADGSVADEGGFGTGGYPWSGGGGGVGYDEPSPWKMDIGADDRLYVDDWFQSGNANGVVMSFDQVLSTNYFNVLRTDNYPYSSISLSGPCVCGEGTNMQIFMADYNTFFAGGLGILSWALNSNSVAASNDIGTVDVTLSNNLDLTLSPYTVSVDTNGNIYTIQDVQDMNFMDATNDPNPRVMCFPPTPSGGPPDTTALWNIGSGDPTLVNAYGVAVDPTATFVAVASRGYGDQPDALLQGGTSIFLANSGLLVTNISQDPEGNTNQEMIDVAWDNVGNLYANDFSDSVWRVYSPPGPNQATTVAVPIIQVYNVLTPPQLSVPTNCMGQVNFTLTGQSNVTYITQQSPDLMNWTAIATNFSPTDVLLISVAPPDTQDFYRAMAVP
jgi:FlgD Ig-like domain